MSAVSFHTDGFRSALRDLYAAILNNSHQALKAAVRAARAKAEASRLFNDVTGTLRDSITDEITGPLEGRVVAGAPYARFVNDGTPPHVIRGKRGGVLHFQVQGYEFFRRVVHHPGTKPRPFMGEAADEGEMVLDYGLEYLTEQPIAHFNSGE